MVKHYVNMNSSINLTIIDVGEEENAATNAQPPSQRFHYILHYIIKGKGLFKSSTQETYKLSAGNVFVVYKQDTVYYESEHNHPLHYYWVGFDGSDSEKILHQLGFSHSNQVVTLNNHSSVRDAFHKLLYSYTEKDQFGNLSRFFNCLNVLKERRYGTTPTPVQNSDELLDAAIRYMENNLNKNVTIEDISNELHIDRSTFSKKFKTKFNTPPHEYFLRMKLTKAETLLEMSDYTISQISDTLGFTDNYIFSKIFKKYYGVSPNAYRKSRLAKKSNRSKP